MFSFSRHISFAILAATFGLCLAAHGDGAEGVSHMVSPNITSAEELSKQLKVAKGTADGIVGTAKASSVDKNSMNRLANNIGATVSKAITSGTTGAARDTQNGTEDNTATGKKVSAQLGQNGRNHLANISKAIQEASELMENLRPAIAAYRQANMEDQATQLEEDIKTIGKIRTSLEAEAAATQTEIAQADDAAKKFTALENTAGNRSEDMSSLSAKDALAFAQQAAGGSGSGGGGSSSGGTPGMVASQSGSYPSGGMALQGGPTSQSRSPASMYGASSDKNGHSPLAKDDFGNFVGSGSKFSGNNTTSSSVGSLKEKLRGELAGRKSQATTPDPALAKAIEDAKAGKAAAKPDLLNPEANATAPSEAGDLGLAVGLGGSGDFGDMLKGILGINPSEQNLSEEEKALLESRQLASLSSRFAPLPPEVLGADTQNLFKRTRERIEASLKRGKVMNGLNSKL